MISDKCEKSGLRSHPADPPKDRFNNFRENARYTSLQPSTHAATACGVAGRAHRPPVSGALQAARASGVYPFQAADAPSRNAALFPVWRGHPSRLAPLGLCVRSLAQMLSSSCVRSIATDVTAPRHLTSFVVRHKCCCVTYAACAVAPLSSPAHNCRCIKAHHCLRDLRSKASAVSKSYVRCFAFLLFRGGRRSCG